MYLLGKRPGPQVDVRLREVSALEDVRFKEVLLYIFYHKSFLLKKISQVAGGSLPCL